MGLEIVLLVLGAGKMSFVKMKSVLSAEEQGIAWSATGLGRLKKKKRESSYAVLRPRTEGREA